MKRISLLAVFILSASSAAFGQTALATVTGTITDQTGAAVANARVSLKNTENGQVYEAASSGAGNFTVPQLPLGEYNLTVAVSSFKTYEHSRFQLSARGRYASGGPVDRVCHGIGGRLPVANRK
jgi:hypothetical protein